MNKDAVKQEKKFRMTQQRKIIMECLHNELPHATADKVFQVVRKKLPHISLGTVYRNLEILNENNQIQKLHLSAKKRVFDITTTKHYHIVCNSCGQVEDVPGEPMTSYESAVIDSTGYKIFGHHLEFEGQCPTCQVSPEA